MQLPDKQTLKIANGVLLNANLILQNCCYL